MRIRDVLAERTAAIRTQTHTLLRLERRRIFKQKILKMVVIRTVTMMLMIWLLFMIKKNGSKIRQHLKRHMKECPGIFYISQLVKKYFKDI